MTETQVAGWGVPPFLPPAVARRVARDDAREAVEARRAEAERERRTEERHSAALALYREQAEARGQVLDVMAMARGEVQGRSLQDILTAAVAASAVEDRRAEMRAWQQGHGEPERLQIEVAEPVIAQARSETGWRIFNRARHFRDVLEARRRLAAAEEAAERTRDHFPLAQTVTLRSEPAPRRRGGTVPADSGLRFR